MVEITSNTKTLELTGGETELHFSAGYGYFWARNDGGGTVLMSLSPNIEEGKDGVIAIPAGGSAGTMHGFAASRNKLYLLGTGRVQIMGTYSAHNPFKQARKGGDIKPIVSGFDMTGIKARFDVSGIDIENKIWTNDVKGGEDLIFTDGNLIDNSLMIPGNQRGEFPLTDNPEVVYFVAKKTDHSYEDIIFGQGCSSTGHGYRFEIFILTNGQIQLTVWRAPYIETITPIDANKWHLFVIVRDFDKSKITLYIDGNMIGFLNNIYDDGYTGKLYLNCNLDQTNHATYQAYKPCYFKHISAGALPAENELNYMNVIYRNMDWLMQNIVDPANKEE